MAHTEDLEELAEQCLAAAKQVKEYLASAGYQQPTLSQEGPPCFPRMSLAAEQARTQLRTVSQRLCDLSTGPDEFVDFYAYSIILGAVPLKESISYRDLAAKTGTNEGQLKKRIRQLIMLHIFCEPKSGLIAHSARSKLLLDEDSASYVGFECIDSMSAIVHSIDAIEKWGHGSQEPTQTGWQIEAKSDQNVWEIMKGRPDTLKRFMGLLQHTAHFAPLDIAHAVNAFDWASIGEGTVVDIGGNSGHCTIAFAQATTKTKFIVQDIPEVVKRATNPTTSAVPLDLQDRITFMEHDFFTPQPIRGADVYFLRMILHDWSDKHSSKIIQSIVPAMRSNSRILVMEQLQPEVGALPPPFERFFRTQDCMMSCMFNATERDLNEWAALFTAVDSRLRIKSVSTPSGSIQSIIEVVLDDDDDHVKGVNGLVHE